MFLSVCLFFVYKCPLADNNTGSNYLHSWDVSWSWILFSSTLSDFHMEAGDSDPSLVGTHPPVPFFKSGATTPVAQLRGTVPDDHVMLQRRVSPTTSRDLRDSGRHIKPTRLDWVLVPLPFKENQILYCVFSSIFFRDWMNGRYLSEFNTVTVANYGNSFTEFISKIKATLFTLYSPPLYGIGRIWLQYTSGAGPKWMNHATAWLKRNFPSLSFWDWAVKSSVVTLLFWKRLKLSYTKSGDGSCYVVFFLCMWVPMRF